MMKTAENVSTNPRSRCVFVGNIPYDATEQQLTEIFNEVGPVVNFRLVFDRETGKARGYGFCEYRDAETALSAMRNLNNFELNGRPLRVDFAETEKSGSSSSSSSASSSSSSGVEGRGRNNPDQVAGIMEELTIQQVYDVVLEMKTLINSNVDNARQILINNPQLAYALLHAQLILGMINSATLQRLLQSQPTQPPQQQQPPPQQPQQPPQQPQPLPPQNFGYDGMGGARPGMGPSGQMGTMNPNSMVNQQQQQPPTYPSYPHGFQGVQGLGSHQGGLGGGGPPPQTSLSLGPNSLGSNPAVAALLNLPSLDEKQRSLLQQVLQLTPQQLENLPPVQRQQVEGLLNVLRSGGLAQ